MLYRNFGLEQISRIAFGTALMMLLFVAGVSAADYDLTEGAKVLWNNTDIGSVASTWTVDDSGGADYMRIQDAIDNASDGDTIEVRSGIYYEKVNVTRQVILKGIDIGGGIPVVDAGYVDIAINFGVGNSVLEGFNVKNGSKHGIYISSNNNTIVNNLIDNHNINMQSRKGISLNNSNNNTLNNNLIQYNDIGIYLLYSSNNTIYRNLADNNKFSNIYLGSSNNNTLYSNSANWSWGFEWYVVTPGVYKKRYYGKGIYMTNSKGNLLKNNNIYNNNYIGVDLWKSNNTRLTDNNVDMLAEEEGHGIGIKISDSNNNTLSDNNIYCHPWKHCDKGIFLTSSGQEYSGNNLIYHNNIFYYKYLSYDDSFANFWDSGYPAGGNYWSDYSINDDFKGSNQDLTGSDGIGDRPYNISGIGAQDKYPFMKQDGWLISNPIIALPCESCRTPTDPDSHGLYEDINGNGRKDFNDVVVFFNYLEWVAGNEPISNFDFNGNGRIDFNDIIKLFEEL
jgi:parallel beta-helix repeat protein